jgi:hypothetical protein
MVEQRTICVGTAMMDGVLVVRVELTDGPHG